MVSVRPWTHNGRSSAATPYSPSFPIALNLIVPGDFPLPHFKSAVKSPATGVQVFHVCVVPAPLAFQLLFADVS